MRSKYYMKHPLLYLCLSVLIGGCIFMSNSLKTQSVSGEVSDPVKIHLKDGKTALFRSGATFKDNVIIGQGVLFSLSLKDSSKVAEINRSEVAAYEVFDSKVKAIPTIVGSGFAVGLTALGVAALSVAIFGSCPTIYSLSDSTVTLESELFSNSIAPMLETRDVTKLQAKADQHGQLIFEVRNEALETHYINQLGLLEVSHENDQIVVPSAYGDIYILGNLLKAERIENSLGEDLRNIVDSKDGISYESNLIQADEEVIKWDTLEMEFSKTPGDTSALVMNLRNSLYSTVLLYDYLFASQGVASLDWISQDLETVSGAVALGDFDRTFNGLKVQQKINGKYQDITRIPNVGPIAWRDLAIPIVPINNESTLKLRLVFLADSWRIDKVRLAGQLEEAKVNYLEISEIVDRNGDQADRLLTNLHSPDDQYIVTYPGDSFNIVFNLQENSSSEGVTYLLEGSGYYIEWIRDKWLEDKEEKPQLFSKEMVLASQQKWAAVKHDFQEKFFNHKVPIK